MPIAVPGNRVIGQASGNGFNANGTFELIGTLSLLTVTTPVVITSDGMSHIFPTQVADATVPGPSSLIMGGMSTLAFTDWGLRRRKQAASMAQATPRDGPRSRTTRTSRLRGDDDLNGVDP